MPSRRPRAPITGAPEISWSTRKRASSRRVRSSVTVSTSVVMTSRAVSVVVALIGVPPCVQGSPAGPPRDRSPWAGGRHHGRVGAPARAGGACGYNRSPRERNHLPGGASMLMSRKSVALGCGFALAIAVTACGGNKENTTSTSGGNQTAAAPAGGSAPSAASKPAGNGPTGTASVSGTVTYDGQVPKLPAISMAADPNCAAKHPGGEAPSDMLVLGDSNHMGNVFVYVKD